MWAPDKAYHDSSNIVRKCNTSITLDGFQTTKGKIEIKKGWWVGVHLVVPTPQEPLPPGRLQSCELCTKFELCIGSRILELKAIAPFVCAHPHCIA